MKAAEQRLRIPQLNEEVEAAGAAARKARLAMLATPAPDVEALACKLQGVVDYDCDSRSSGIMDALNDARRLASEA